MKRRDILAALPAAAGAALVGPRAMAQQLKWDMPSEYQETAITSIADKLFARKLGEKSAGKINVVHHFSGSLGYKSKDHWQAVEDGAVPIASSFTGVFTGLAPIFNLTSMPFLATNVDQAYALMLSGRSEFAAAFERSGQRLVFVSPWAPVGLWAKRSVRSAADLRNLKVRTYDRNGTITLRNAGAAAVQLSWSDVVPALTTGAIEAVLTSDEGGIAARFDEHMKFFHQLNFVMGHQMVHINRKLLEGLPADLQKAVTDAGAESEKESWAMIRDRIEQNKKTLAERGVAYVGEAPAEFIQHLKTAAKDLIDEWKKSMPAGVGDRILADYRQRGGSA
ncbi:MAG: TRAP transporter substrate-binding protein [Alphaproteobacteria bacterium]|nr:TRAP transporter substrate-binding protein [Alphaproteobacteria bacterium]